MTENRCTKCIMFHVSLTSFSRYKQKCQAPNVNNITNGYFVHFE